MFRGKKIKMLSSSLESKKKKNQGKAFCYLPRWSPDCLNWEGEWSGFLLIVCWPTGSRINIKCGFSMKTNFKEYF